MAQGGPAQTLRALEGSAMPAAAEVHIHPRENPTHSILLKNKRQFAARAAVWTGLAAGNH